MSFEDQTLVMQQVKDADGNTLFTNNFFAPSSVSETKANIKLETMKRSRQMWQNENKAYFSTPFLYVLHDHICTGA